MRWANAPQWLIDDECKKQASMLERGQRLRDARARLEATTWDGAPLDPDPTRPREDLRSTRET